MVLTAENISKRIRGKTILDDISLEMLGGHIYGFAGPNGCGKTMLFRALSGLMSINSGKVYLNRQLLHDDFSVLPSLGLTIENVGMYPGLTGLQNLEYLAGIKGIANLEQIKATISRVGLDPLDKRTYRKYSLGMKQRLALAQAIMEKPDVIMLDEPTNALDRDGVDIIRNVILQEKARGAIILMASHNLDDIRSTADFLFEMENGKIIHRMEVVR